MSRLHLPVVGFTDHLSCTQHLNSATHKPANIRCPMRHCDRHFISPSALVPYIESNTCISRMTRHQLDNYVLQLDRRILITQKRITGPSYFPPPTYTATEGS